MKNILIIVALLFIVSCSSLNDAEKAQLLIDYNKEKYSDFEPTGTLVDGVRVINVKANQFYFTPDVIVVNKGERVRLIISAEDVPHGFEIEGFAIPDYDTNTVINPGEPITLEFVADEVGVWDFICTIFCGFGHHEMKGTFIVI